MQLPEFTRNQVEVLLRRLRAEESLLQVVLGPRQVGKTTALLQLGEAWDGPTVYGSADAPAPPGPEWVEQMWQTAAAKATPGEQVLLVLDEVQKVQGWAESVKALWDRQRYAPNPLRVVVCGSSSLQLQSGIAESLAGRFERVFMPHWSFAEMEQCFGWDLETYLYHGGYPGAAFLVRDTERWAEYVQQSLVESVLGKDILLLHRVQKPALLRQLFALGCASAGHIVSYQKMVGQLQDAGNTTTLAHYQHLFEAAYLLAGLQKWQHTQLRQRASSPKWQPFNTALVTAPSGLSPDVWRADLLRWGRLVEVAVGAHLVNQAVAQGISVRYWRERNVEVDFVLQQGERVAALEVKSGSVPQRHRGLEAFAKRYPGAATWVVGSEGLSVETCLRQGLRGYFL